MIISSGKYDIIESGNAILFDEDSDVVIDVNVSHNFKFRIVVSFIENGGDTDLTKDVDVKTNVINFKCINFGLGAGTTHALEIGRTGSKRIYLHFWAEKVLANTLVRNFQYTVYKER